LGIKPPARLARWTRSVLERTPNRFLFWIRRPRPQHPDNGYDRYTPARSRRLARDALQEMAHRAAAPEYEIVRNAGETRQQQRDQRSGRRWRSAGGEHVRIHAWWGRLSTTSSNRTPHLRARFLPLPAAAPRRAPSDTTRC